MDGRAAGGTAAPGTTLDEPPAARILWWGAFEALRNGYWIDSRGGTARLRRA